MKDPLDQQIVVRVPTWMKSALEADAEANGRTVAQTVRFLLIRQLGVGVIRRNAG